MWICPGTMKTKQGQILLQSKSMELMGNYIQERIHGQIQIRDIVVSVTEPRKNDVRS